MIQPDEEELAAIVAAIEIAWPKPVVAAPLTTTETSRWRFAGRWWSKPIPARRDRPW
ncbi:MAG: acetyl-CoA/propionyl-CoA carboxylase, PccX subunit [Acidimicrobiaceae bacterium]|nr:acetyl-CoA/propionyl-CoA carboxylase, PccX subunit [Acidimicrobiaceae bacterium]